MRRFLLILAVVLFAMTAFAAIAPGLYRVNVNSTLNVRNAPGGAKIGSLSNGDLVQVTACEDDWAQVSLNDGRTGYVHEQYLEPFSTLAAPAGTSYSTVGLSELRHYTPFAILLFAVIAFIGLRTDTRSLFHAGCLLWGGAELFMFGAGSDSALVWFCDPSDVGWIFTIINFFVAIGILFFQYTIYREFTGSLFDGFWRKLLFGIFIKAGSITVNGILLEKGTIDQIRRQVAWIPQELALPSEWVKEMVQLPFNLKANRNPPFSLDKLFACFDELGLEEELYDKRVNEISGGQRQRIMIAVATLMQKPLLIVDEPTSALDSDSTDKVLAFFRKRMREGSAILAVSHDQGFAQGCNQMITL